MIKLRVTMPKDKLTILKYDQVEFEINENKHYNIIYANMDFTYDQKKSHSVYNEDTALLQFTLNKENFSKFAIPAHNKIKKADFFRQLLTEYTDKNFYERELIIFKNEVNFMTRAIEGNRKIEISFKDRKDILDPYFIASLKKENRNYLVSYSRHKGTIVSYRVKNIRDIKILDENRSIFDESYIKTLQKNFNPFLSFGSEIKVKFTPEGEKYYRRIITNRPNLIRREDNLWVFEANEYQAMLYFAGFMEMVEIIEPLDLREKLKERVKEMIKIYNLYKTF